MEGNRIHFKVLYMNLETTRLRGWKRNRWQDEVRKDGRMVGGKGWKERVYITERNGRSSCERQGIVSFCTCQWNEWMNEWMKRMNYCKIQWDDYQNDQLHCESNRKCW
jgi:hypothetical protein